MGKKTSRWGERYGLPVYNPVDDHGRFKPDTPLVAGQAVFAANATILAQMRANGSLLFAETYVTPIHTAGAAKNR